MRKAILAVLLLSLLAVPAMAVTFAALGTQVASGTASVSGIDNSVIYLVTNKGAIYSQAISGGAFTLLATIPKEKATAIVNSGATYNYVGTASGKIVRHTISGNALSFSALIACTIPAQAITGMKWDATLSVIYVTTNKGKTYVCTP